MCRCGIFALHQSGALINSTRQPVACLPRRLDRLSTLGAARLGDRKPLRALPGDGPGLFDFVAGPGLQRFELRLQVPVISSQGLEFRLRTCQSRLPGIVESRPFFFDRGFLLIQLLLPGLDASLGPGNFPLELGDSPCSAITISTNGFELFFQRSRVESIAGRALPNELLKVPFAKLGIKLSFEPLQLPPALGDACGITSKSRCLTRFLLGFTSQISGLGKRLLAGTALRDDLFQAVNCEALEQSGRRVGPLRSQPRSSLTGVAAPALNLDLTDTLQLQTEARGRFDRNGPSQVVRLGWSPVGACREGYRPERGDLDGNSHLQGLFRNPEIRLQRSQFIHLFGIGQEEILY